MSDSDIIAMPLAAKIGYQNTYLHQAPQLDLLRPPQALRGTVDVVVCAEVLEHIPPSIDVAINNLFALLVPGGSAIITVPYRLNEQTLEHYPRLHEYRLEQRAGETVLINRTRDGHSEEYTGLIFHGGPSSTLEMRVFALAPLLQQLERAGFREVQVLAEPVFDFGIYWREACSITVTAKRPLA